MGHSKLALAIHLSFCGVLGVAGAEATFSERAPITLNADAAWPVIAADEGGDGDTDVLSAFGFDDKVA